MCGFLLLVAEVTQWNGPGAGARPARSVGRGAPGSFYFLPAFFLPAMVLRGPLLERAFVLVR